MSRSHPTIHDVAARAGVSKSLVSLVMRGATNVSDERRAAVEKAAAELGYRPNAVAKSLVRGRSFVIGLVVADLHNPYFTDMVDSVTAASSDDGYRTIMGSGFQSPEREAEAVDTLLQLRVDGLILAGSHLADSDVEAIAKTVPVVLIARTLEADSVDSVTVDDRAGARLAVEHLHELGHQRIAHLHGGTGAGAQDRLSGYEVAMEAAGLSNYVTATLGNYTEADGEQATHQLLEQATPPSAIFAGNDYSALGALSAAAAAGVNVPADLSIVGFDNTSAAKLGHIQLTTVEQPSESIARHAVELVLERIEGRTEPKHVLTEPRLIVRSTTGAPREV